MDKKILIFMIIAMIGLASAIPTTYSPFTGKLDFYGIGNDIVGYIDNWFFSNNGNLDFNETKLNNTIESFITNNTISSIEFSENSYNGNITNGSYYGYDAVNSICNLENKGHACSESEISEVIYLDIYSTSGVGWVIAGGPKYAPANHPVSDCSGFTNDGTGSTDPLGNFWSFDSNGGKGIAGNCGLSYPIICCK